jgi:RNA polymerase sigma factor (sigma-70 family)
MIGTHHQNPQFVNATQVERTSAIRRDTTRPGRELRHLVRAAARRDERAWAEVVARFAQRVRRIARSYRLGEDEAEDVVQATFIRLFEHVGTLREPNALPSWLETTARRESLRRLRARGRDCALDADAVECIPEPEREPERVDDEVRAALAAAVARLPERQRLLLALLQSEQEPNYRAIAQALRIPIGSIGPTRARALERLRRDTRLASIAADAVHG